MPQIIVVEIPHDKQRYDTVGDWDFDPEGNITVKVSEGMDKWSFYCVALHEIIEAILCKDNYIMPSAVDRFDMLFEENRKLSDDSEPGDDPNCPYYEQHQFATAIERLVAHELELTWKEHEDEVKRVCLSTSPDMGALLQSSSLSEITQEPKMLDTIDPSPDDKE
jgi:hypothetical protein